jgi:hypothetical protein
MIDDPGTGIFPDWTVPVNDATYTSGRFGTFDTSQPQVIDGPRAGSCNIP